eukprot:9468242-Pyramimonas_sp.AAC.6
MSGERERARVGGRRCVGSSLLSTRGKPLNVPGNPNEPSAATDWISKSTWGDSHGDPCGDSYGDPYGASYGDSNGDTCGDSNGDSYGGAGPLREGRGGPSKGPLRRLKKPAAKGGHISRTAGNCRATAGQLPGNCRATVGDQLPGTCRATAGHAFAPCHKEKPCAQPLSSSRNLRLFRPDTRQSRPTTNCRQLPGNCRATAGQLPATAGQLPAAAAGATWSGQRPRAWSGSGSLVRGRGMGLRARPCSVSAFFLHSGGHRKGECARPNPALNFHAAAQQPSRNFQTGVGCRAPRWETHGSRACAQSGGALRVGRGAKKLRAVRADAGCGMAVAQRDGCPRGAAKLGRALRDDTISADVFFRGGAETHSIAKPN